MANKCYLTGFGVKKKTVLPESSWQSRAPMAPTSTYSLLWKMVFKDIYSISSIIAKWMKILRY